MSPVVAEPTRFPPPLALDTDAVMAGLARRGFAVLEQAFPEAFLDALEAEARAAWQAGDYQSAGVGREADRVAEIRADHILWIEPEAPTALQARYLDALGALRLGVRRELYLPVDEIEAHFAVYPAGAFYRRHLDQFRGTPHRWVSCLLYLNRDWTPEDGGQLRLHVAGEDGAETWVDVFPEYGTFACFLSDCIEHEVLPTARPRTSLAAWLRQRRVI